MRSLSPHRIMVLLQFFVKCFYVTAFLQAVVCKTLNQADECVNNNLGVIGGRKVPVVDAPYIAELYFQAPSKKYYSHCGASIIHERFVLTAAHCVVNLNQHLGFKPAKRILVGSNRLDIGGTSIDVEEEFCHEGYDNYNLQNDICLLKLKKPVTFGPNVDKIKLPDEDFDLEAGTLVNVTGYGAVGATKNTKGELFQTTMPVLSDACCMELYAYVKDKRQICAGSLGHDSCGGDSGGPMTYKGVQLGIVSYGEDCTWSEASVYTRVTSFVNWIHRTIEGNL